MSRGAIHHTALLQALVVALDAIPEHRVTISNEIMGRLGARLGEGSGIMVESGAERGEWVFRIADHEDRLVFADRTRSAGGVLIDDGETMLGVIPLEEDDEDDNDGA